MTRRIGDPDPLSANICSAADGLIERLRAHYPDMSGFTVVSMTGRGRDFLHHLVHTRIGGLLPGILSFEDYRTNRVAEDSGLMPVPEDEALLRFHALRCREEGPSQAPADSQRLLSFLTTIAEFSVNKKQELQTLERIGQEQLDRIDRFFETREAFRTHLADGGMFYPPFEAERFADLTPRDGEFFFGLPLMTPVNERFFNRIPRDRRFIDAPCFGSCMPKEPPDYETALSLVRRMGIVERRDSVAGIDFSELSERSALPAFLAHEIHDFLRQSRDDSEQMFVVPLDERRSFYLWELLFRSLGKEVNFSPWLPFTHFAAAHRLRNAIRNGKRLEAVRRELAGELANRWTALDEADRSAFEAAISFCDELERFRPLMGADWSSMADYLIATKKLRLHGRRSAPIQIVGMGDATGIRYRRAVILPMNSGIFPRKPFSGPYLNLLHLPRIHRAQFEADDLALRQFLSFGRETRIAALYDKANGEAPSPHFAFLATEFGGKPVKRRIEPEKYEPTRESPFIENTDEQRERLAKHIWSFSSLGIFFTCPYRFVLEYVQKIKPPPCFEEEERANLLIGNFVHRLFAELKNRRPVIDRWREAFEAMWANDEEIREKLPDRDIRRAIVQSYLADIADWERDSGHPILFSDEITDTELELQHTFGEGRYRLKGRIDRLQHCDGKTLIVDLKYKEKREGAGRLADQMEKTNAFDERFQLLIYAYLAVRTKTAAADKLDASYLFLRPRTRGDYEGRLPEKELADAEATMELLAKRLDDMLRMEQFAPNYRSESCNYCPHKALCLKPDLYRAGGRSW
ncbi:MAG: PD-(D/E)XK nuclease family protein [Syntrophales bacterium]|nr:PD-(D/E)XK nuclease family protein [Syntrophales bacterium]